MNRTRRILSALALTFLVGTTSACLVTARGQMQGGSVVAYDQPPAPRQENPGVMQGHVWVQGKWTWQNNQWMWVDGHWERERSGSSRSRADRPGAWRPSGRAARGSSSPTVPSSTPRGAVR